MFHINYDEHSDVCFSYNIDFVFDFSGASWFHSDELDMDGTATMIPRRESLQAVKVHQVCGME